MPPFTTRGDGHTGNDSVLFIPSEGILFMSDRLFVDTFPFLADGDPDNLLTILEEIGQMDAPVLVLGMVRPATTVTYH